MRVYSGFFLLLLAAGFIATAAHAKQGRYVSAECPRGGEAAKAITEQAIDFERGRKGIRADISRAEELFEKALRQGDAAAALNLGLIYRANYSPRPDARARQRFSVAMYRQAIDMGCPEGYQNLADAYENGWGVVRDSEKALEMWRTAADKGGLDAMAGYGDYLVSLAAPIRGNVLQEERRRLRAEGKALMEESLRRGNGHAAGPLSRYYDVYEDDTEAMIRVLREGSRLGSMDALYSLYFIYRGGLSGQPKDEAYADRIYRVRASIDEDVYPRPIPDFDRLVPPRKVLPKPAKGSK